MKRLLVLFTYLAVCAGCGENDDSARPQCEKLVRTYCQRLVSCAEQDDLFTPEYGARDLEADCFETVTSTALACAKADEVSSDYGACLSAVKRIDCGESNAALLAEEYIAPPAICDDTVLFAD